MAKSIHVLILEDNPADAELAQFELEDAGLAFTPKVVVEEKDFVRELQEFSPDLILSDYDLPKYNGALALTEVKGRCPDTPFILVTGAVSEDRAIEILTQGAKDYVLKHRLHQRLVPAVRRALAEAEEHRARKKAEADLREAHRILEERYAIRTAERDAEMKARAKVEVALRKSESRERAQAAELRRRAEERMQADEAAVGPSEMGVDSQRLLQELQIYRIELEMQNEELRRARDDAEAERERYLDLYEFAPAGYFTLDRDGGILGVNLAGARLLGVERSRLLNCRFGLFVSESDVPVFDAFIKSVFAEKVKKRCTIALRKKGCPCFYIQIEAIASDDGRECRAAALDVTECRHLEEELREQSEGRFRNLLQSIPSVAVQSYEPDGTTRYWNQAAERLYGYTAEEAIGRNLLDLIIPPEMRNDVQHAVREMAETGQAIPASELSLMRKDGSRVSVYSSHAVVRIPGRAPELFCMDIDLTERKWAEHEKAKLQDQLRHSQKMESVGRLAGGVAHDFNNMLGVILGHVEMALDHVHPAHPLYPDLQTIRKAAGRSADLTRQLLAFARKQAVSPEVLNLNDTVTGVFKMLRRLIGEDIHLTWLPGANLWPVKVDPSQLDQILANLCVNARDAIAGVGKITIETGNASFDEAYCADHTDCIPGDYVQLAVSDDGCGMDQETLGKIFEPFFTTKEMGKGTGLGLATIYGVVRQNNGFINVSSGPGQGTIFRVNLPRHAGQAEQPRTEEPQEPATPGKETILVVEDEPEILNMARRMLENQGYRVLTADTPGEASRVAEQYAGTIHLLMTDVVMPGMNGRDLAKQMLSRYPDMKRLFMSGYTADIIARQGVLDDGVHFIQKPFSRKDLATKVRGALDKKTS